MATDTQITKFSLLRPFTEFLQVIILPVLRIHRKDVLIARKGSYQLLLNGEPLGSIDNGAVKEFIIPAGNHTLQAQSKSAAASLNIDLEAGSEKDVSVHVFKGAANLLLIIVLLALLQLAFVFFEQTKWLAAWLFLVYPVLATINPFGTKKFLRLTEIGSGENTAHAATAFAP